MKSIFTTFFSLLIGVSLLAQQTINDANAEVRDVKGFRGVKVQTGIQLILTQGSTEAVAISAPSKEDRDKIKTEIENGILIIHYDYDFWKLMRGKVNKELKAYVSIVKVEELGVSSGATLKTDGAIKAGNLTVKASSGGVMQAKVTATSMNVDQSSGAVIEMSGTADDLELEGSSGSVFNGYDMVVNTCNARTSSGAVTHVTVNKEMSGRASSGGVVAFRGDGNIRSKKTSSGGSVSKVK